MKSTSKRIAKNTVFLYIRMLFLMVITLFTSRVLLDKLGIEDFGIYNVVGGLAAMFAFFQSSLANATQRFLNVELGKSNLNGACLVFSQHLILYVIVALFIVVIGETIGLWFVYNKLVIPFDRLDAAVWVYHFTLMSLCVTLVGIAFNSEIIAHEDMKIYSYVGVFEGLARLGIAYVISISSFDKLIIYGFLLLLLSFVVQGIYAYFCIRHYEECKLRFIWDNHMLRDALSIVGWNTVGTAVYAVNDSGINILLNIFFGPAVNAARAISFQVNSAVNNFTSNFIVSVRPQIVKSYANGDYDYLLKLFYNSSKYSFFLLWLLCIPLAFRIDQILVLWLKEVPEYTSAFTIWILAYSLVNVLNNPIWSLALAVGKLKRYITIGSGVFLLVFPLAYIALYMGASPISVFIILFFVRLLYLIVVLYIIKSYINYSYRNYFRKVISPISRVMLLSLVMTIVVHQRMTDSLTSMFVFILIVSLINMACIWLCGTSSEERLMVKNIINKKMKRHECNK